MTKAAYTLKIPSVEDGTILECRIYHAKDLSRYIDVKGAVVAHPYAPLGGSYDDLVILNIVETLLNHGYIVGTFNFRYARILDPLWSLLICR